MATQLALPRFIPPSVRTTLMFGGALNQVGYAIIAFGSIFFWGFVANSDLTSWRTFSGPLVKVHTKIAAVRDAHMTVNKKKVYAYDYAYQAEGKTYTGTSYATGQVHRAGESVMVEYPAKRPGVSRIVGMRTKMLGAWGAVLVVVPLTGIGLVVAGMKKGRKAMDLLANGMITGARLVDQKPTNTRVNNQTVYALTFSYKAANGMSHQITVKTHRVDRLTDEASEMLLYDVMNPERAILFDALPGRISLNEEGGFDAVPRAVLYLLLPMLAIGGNLLYVVLRFF